MIAAVFDCVVYVQAVLSRKGPAFACLSLAEEKRITLVFSPEILDEVKRSLDRPSLRRKNARLTDETVERFIERIMTAGTLTQNPPQVFTLRRDPKDEPYLNLAIGTNAGFVVSRDKDMLDLMSDSSFRNAYPALTIIDPLAFLTHVRNEESRKRADK
jgi:putative PIN family toxin of toxin-antitoxin system